MPGCLKGFNAESFFFNTCADGALFDQQIELLGRFVAAGFDQYGYITITAMRTAVIFGELNERDKNYLLENLTTESNNWVFKNFESAKKYAELFFKLNRIYYAGFASALMFRTVGDCLKYALQKRYISENDLYATDKMVIEKVKTFLDRDEKLKLLWERMNGKIRVGNNPKDYDAQVFCKSRIVDPLFRNNGALKRISEVESDWNNTIKQELKPKHYFLKFGSAAKN